MTYAPPGFISSRYMTWYAWTLVGGGVVGAVSVVVNAVVHHELDWIALLISAAITLAGVFFLRSPFFGPPKPVSASPQPGGPSEPRRAPGRRDRRGQKAKKRKRR